MNKNFSGTIADLAECDGIEIVGQDKVADAAAVGKTVHCVMATSQGTAIVSTHETGRTGILQWSLDDGDKVPATDPEQHTWKLGPDTTSPLSRFGDANHWAKHVLQYVVDVPWTKLHVVVWMVEDDTIH